MDDTKKPPDIIGKIKSELTSKHNPYPGFLQILNTVERLRKFYMETGNGVYVWQAIYMVKKARDRYAKLDGEYGLDISAWMIEYLFEVSEFIIDLAIEGDGPDLLPKALEMETSGQGSAFSQNKNEIMRYHAVNLAYSLKKTMKPGRAYEQTADEINSIFNKDYDRFKISKWCSENKHLLD